MSTSQKENRGQASLVSKMTRKEVGRRFGLMIGIDFLVILIFFFGLLLYGDMIASEFDVTNISKQNAAFIFEEVEFAGPPNGFKLDLLLGHRPSPYVASIYRNVWLDQPVTSFFDREFVESLASFRYALTVAQAAHPGKYWVLTFSYQYAIRTFLNCLLILICFEAIGLFADSFDIRKSIRKSLRPIYDLTLAAQNMNATASPIVKLPGQELHLSGAIDTLNNITEDDLGRRIVIGDEREELRGLAEAINAMLDRLDAAYRSQLRFVSDASHELRTPISVIQGYANMLDRWGKNDTDTLQESIDAIKTEASGMQDLVEQLLFLARSDNRSIVLSVATINTYALADEVLRETQMIDPNHEFAARLTEGLCVRGDFQLLKQALRIFVDNAIKYTPNGGKITLSTVSEDHFVKLSVSDTGIGIPAGDLDRVFDRFFRSDESRTRGTGGTGLGLSIAKWIIDRHGGFVELVSREDFGTKITIGLPRYADVTAMPAVNDGSDESERV